MVTVREAGDGTSHTRIMMYHNSNYAKGYYFFVATSKRSCFMFMLCFRRASLFIVSLAYKELRAHIILVTFLCSMWSGMHMYAYRHTSWFRGGAPIHTSLSGGSAYANASWQPVNGLFPFRVAARQALRKKATVCCIGIFFLIVRRCRQLLLLVFSILLFCLLLLCTQRTSSNLFVVVMHSSSVRSTLSARRPFFVQLLFCQSVVCLFPLQKKLSFLCFQCDGSIVPLFCLLGGFVLYTRV